MENNKPSDLDIIGYKFEASLKKQMYDYLQTRPMVEVESLLVTMFECKDPDPFYTEDGIKQLTSYLGQCPRKDVKSFVDAIRNGGLSKYILREDSGNTISELIEEKPAN